MTSPSSPTVRVRMAEPTFINSLEVHGDTRDVLDHLYVQQKSSFVWLKNLAHLHFK